MHIISMHSITTITIFPKSESTNNINVSSIEIRIKTSLNILIKIGKSYISFGDSDFSAPQVINKKWMSFFSSALLFRTPRFPLLAFSFFSGVLRTKSPLLRTDNGDLHHPQFSDLEELAADCPRVPNLPYFQTKLSLATFVLFLTKFPPMCTSSGTRSCPLQAVVRHLIGCSRGLIYLT